MRGRRNPDKPQTTNILPPCRVCGEPGTGFHYGVTTCGACKGFFRRSITRHEPYVCIQSHLCVVGPSTSRRQSCPKCRYDKCIAVGMSKDACKVGRYSLIKKSKDIKEAMEEQEPSLSPASHRSSPTNGITNDWLEQLPEAYVGTSLNSTDLLDLPMKPDHQLKFAKDNNFFNDPSTDKPCTENVLGFLGNPEISPSGNKVEISDSFSDISEDSCNRFGEYSPGVACKHDCYSFMDYSVENNIDSGANHDKDIIDDNHSFSSNEMNKEYDGNNCVSLSYTIFKSLADYSKTQLSIDSNDDHINNSTLISPFTKSNYSCDESSPNSIHGSANTPSVTSWETSKQNLRTISPTSPLWLSDQTLKEELPLCFDATESDPPISDVLQQTRASDLKNEVLTPPLSSTTLCIDFTPTNHVNSNKIVANEFTERDQPELVSDPFSKETFPYSFNDDNTSTTIDTCNNQNILEIPGDICHVSGIHKKRFIESGEDSRSATKRTCFSENLDSSRKLTSDKTNAIVPFLKQNNDKNTKPLVLCIVAPDPMKYALSIFEKFPFKSFEKESLAPLLKFCYDINDTTEKYIPECLVQQKHMRSIGYYSQQPDTTPTICINIILSSAQSSEVSSYASELTYDATEMDSLYDCVESIHRRYYGPKTAYLSESERSMFIEMFLNICKLQDTLQGTMNLVDDDKYFTILETTGIDVDKRREWFSTVFGDFDKGFTRDARFFRALPGFKDFTLKDRVTLTKSTFVIFLLLRHFQTTDFDNGVVIDEEKGVACRMTTFRRILPGVADFIDRWSTTVEALKDLNITFEELMMLKVLCIVLPDLCEDLERPELIVEWHNIYLKCLLRHLRKTHGPRADDRFNMIVGFLQKVKGLREPMKEGRMSATNTLRRLTEGRDQPLFKEIFLNLPYHQE